MERDAFAASGKDATRVGLHLVQPLESIPTSLIASLFPILFEKKFCKQLRRSVLALVLSITRQTTHTLQPILPGL